MTVDVLLVGGGLAGSLVSWRLAQTRPELRLCLVEAGTRLGGNHTWSFHDTDLSPGAREWITPIVAAHWPRHEVRFPSTQRVLTGAYASLTADRLHQVVASALGDRLRLQTRVTRVQAHGVTLETGARIPARLVLDARGDAGVPMAAGWQTFLGQELALDADHGLEWPILMDATVPQSGGFRFVYVLPWGPRSALVEDTRYGDDSVIDRAACRRAIAEYVDRCGWAVRAVVREEVGALPIPLGGMGEAFWQPDDGVVRVGMRAGLFHPTTGYSLPDAVRLADALAGMDLRDADGVYRKVRRMAIETWDDRRFFRRLNRLLFHAAAPAARYRVLEQFYRRPESLIRRFYAGRLTAIDRARVLMGRPPVPVHRALGVLWRGEP